MVAIKIQSLDDIVKAYLENLGFKKNALTKASEEVKKLLEGRVNNDNVLSSLDDLTVASAKQIFDSSGDNAEQLSALFKLSYLTNNGADKWGADIFDHQKITAAMKKQMLEKAICVVPHYQMSEMKPQVIESAQPQKILSHFLRHQ